MPYTQSAITRILNNRTLPKGHTLTRSQAVCEAALRGKLLRFENRAVKDMDAAFKQAWADIHGSGAAAAERLSITGTLSTVNGGQRWRDQVMAYTAQRIDALWERLRTDALNKAITAYQVSYVGKAWGLTASRLPDLPRIPLTPLNTMAMKARIRDEWELRYGDAWDASFARPFVEFKQKARQALNTAVINQETPTQGMARVKALMGVATYKQLYYFSQVNITTLMMVGASLGALQLYTEFGGGSVREAVAGFGAIMGIITAGDGKVCPRCQEASRHFWRVDTMTGIVGAALTFAIPPLHGKCRCMVYLFPLPEELLPPDFPPGLTLAEYLLLEGLGAALGAFDRGDTIKPSDEFSGEFF
jgi:hypothetical protein